jgi:hypothetical protein
MIKDDVRHSSVQFSSSTRRYLIFTHHGKYWCAYKMFPCIKKYVERVKSSNHPEETGCNLTKEFVATLPPPLQRS